MAKAPPDMERQVTTQKPRADTYLLRCFPLGMGSNMQWDMDRRPVVRTGEDIAHQLPEIASSLSCSSNIPEGQVRSLGATTVGQHHCNGLHEQSGGDSVFTIDQSGKISVAMGPSERYLIDSPTHTSNMVADTESRTMRDRTDWKLSPAIFNRINHIFGPLEVDLFASRLTYQLIHYFSWRLDPLAEATDTFQQNWASLKGFANLPWCLIGRILSNPGSSDLERPVMVPSSPEYALGVSSEDTSTPQPSPESSGTGSSGVNPPASCVAYLHEKFSGSSLSEETSRLLLASWRTKSNQSYDSHFRKWISWCAEQGSNPVSGPIAEVVNFLAHLFEQGYLSMLSDLLYHQSMTELMVLKLGSTLW